MNSVLLELGQRYPHIRAWKNPTGQAITLESFDRFLVALKEKPFSEAIKAIVRISFGLVGAADISGIMAPHGKRIEIECKTGTGRLSTVQKNYREMITKQGGIFIECRTLKDLEILSQIEMSLT